MNKKCGRFYDRFTRGCGRFILHLNCRLKAQPKGLGLFCLVIIKINASSNAK
ncbi:hypothetical protein HMPREF9996_00859 [Aggregatibacter actinomycetemcomitans Y4]|nr:hypothetical protein HMPREF9996_00859 [Aggregatibacter actinomycetemcomitans Y4]